MTKIDLNSLHQHERKLLLSLSGTEPLEGVSKKTGINKDAMLRSAFVLQEYGLVDVVEDSQEAIVLTEEGRKFLNEKFPEQRVMEHASRQAQVSSLTEEERKIGVSWAVRNRWVKIANGSLQLISKQDRYPLYEALSSISEGKEVDKKAVASLIERGSVESKVTKSYSFKLTSEGQAAAKKIKESGDSGRGEINELSHALIVSGEWKNSKFRKYNLKAEVERAKKGAAHPINEYARQIKDIFVSMGFEEMEGNEIESGFWNFDALFTPQDHPARELHDTFYLSKPSELDYPDEIGQRVKETHEKSWKYAWDKTVPKQAVLRTHSTTLSAHKLDSLRKKRKPGKFFAISRVYRNEATDFKHLAEFYQIEGIVAWKNANFRNLFGVLQTFYDKLEIEIRFRPHYFPYTEPSVEVERWDEKRNQWIELAGAGILRPEVSIPLWNAYPVLAWGMALERPLMKKLDLKDIRTPYQNDVSWILDSQI